MRRTFILLILALLFSSPLEAAVLNIVAIGASNTSGFGVGAQDAYPTQLQVLLRKKGHPRQGYQRRDSRRHDHRHAAPAR